MDGEGNGFGTVDVGVEISVPPESLQLIVEDPTPDSIELREVTPVRRRPTPVALRSAPRNE